MTAEKRKEWQFGWVAVGDGDGRHYRSARSVDIIEYAIEKGARFEEFLARHAERSGMMPLKLDSIDERGETFCVAHRFNLSWLRWMQHEREHVRIIAVDTCERRLVMESYDLKMIFNGQRLSAEKLRLWRQDSESPVHESMNNGVVSRLLDELERYSIQEVLHENGIDGSKFV